MAMDVKPGTRFRSAACDAEFVVVKAPSGAIDLRCGGHAVRAVDDADDTRLAIEPGFDGGLLIGKRYTDASGALEVLCTKAGASSLAIGDEVLAIKDAKPLPSSD